MSQIECKDVSVKYENQVVLEDISFSIDLNRKDNKDS